MSRNSRDDSAGNRERTAEQRERDRLEREARRAGGQPARGPATPPSREQPPTQDLDDRARPPISPDARGAADPRGPRAGRAPARGGPGDPTARTGRGAGRRTPRSGQPANEPPPEPRGRARAEERRAASRRLALPGAARVDRPPLRIQPDPPAPPAAAAGELGDEHERPIGIRRVRRVVTDRSPLTPRSPRTIVTPPGDVPAGPARARRSAGSKVAAVIALAVLAVLIVGVLMLFQPFGSAQGKTVRVTIPQGAGAREIGDQLAAHDVVASGLLFSVRAALAGKRSDLRSGPVTLHKSMTYGDAIDALSKKTVVAAGAQVKVTIPEGRSRQETAARIGNAGLSGDYLTASKRFSGRLNPYRYGAPKPTRSTEGFLFPATYELKPGAPVSDLVDKQLAAFKDNFASVDLKRAKRKNLTAYDVLIIGSMVEREAQLASERAKIAAVIYNRLKAGMALGIDATIRYALNNWTRPLKASELNADGPYNTRKRKGLPPTPIGNPGLASLRAAAAPAKVDYLYYVVKPGTCGKHAFSSTNEQFQRDSQRYNQARNAAGGKSPTTC
jgi:UPF0755 protein